MSRVGRRPISVPTGVGVDIDKDEIKVKGPKGELKRVIPPLCKVVFKDKQILVKKLREDKQSKSLQGALRSLIFNMVKGVTEGFEKNLEIVGGGYKAELKDRILVLSLGYSHFVKYTPPREVDVKLAGPNEIRIFGLDKQIVGEIAAEIRALKKPEPYGGKGIRYKGELIRRKVGKKAALGAKIG
ncbi:MAG: 50S ribosomal protein L6 [Candidatus Aerophobetes bacterium]|nr:50S ribosomal protein L6 [Candidatus Aerophobetes bacterium]